MGSNRVFVLLSCTALLSACTSADVALRKPQPPQTDGTDAAMPTPAVRPLHATTRRAVPVVPPAKVPRTSQAQPVGPQAPVPVTSCDPGGCWGSDNRYQGGTGNTYLDRNGRMCQGNGTWMQCY